MTDTLDLDDIDQTRPPKDFRRASGAPMVMVDGKNVRLSRPSNYAKPLDDESALTNWRINTACRGVAGDRALQAAWVAVAPDDRKSMQDLREKATQAGRGNEGSDIGIAIHAMTVRWEQDPTFSPPSPYLESLEAYQTEMEALGLVSVHYEVHTVNLEFGSAGTADRTLRLTRRLIAPDGTILDEGTLIIGDIKTNKTLEYSMAPYSVQLALYAGGQFYDPDADVFLDTPEINQDWAVIVWLPANEPGVCVIFWIDLRRGREGAELARTVKNWRKWWRGTEGAPIVVQAEPTTPSHDATSPSDGHDWVDVMRPWVIERVRAIGHHKGARTYLTTRWPEGVPVPQAVVEPEHMTQILDLLDKTEAEFALPFVPGRPATGGGHARSMHIINTQPQEATTS